MHIGLAGFRLRKATLKAKVVRLLTFRGVIRFDNLVGPLLPRSKIYAPAANTVLASWLLVVWESVSSNYFCSVGMLFGFDAATPPTPNR
jgi:hypothetical protein